MNSWRINESKKREIRFIRPEGCDCDEPSFLKIRDTPELNTLYIGPGVYLWSGLRIEKISDNLVELVYSCKAIETPETAIGARDSGIERPDDTIQTPNNIIGQLEETIARTAPLF